MKRQILFLTAALTAAVLAGCSTTDNAGNENQNGSSGSVVENVVPNHGNTQQDTENNNQNTSSGTSQNEGEGQDYKMGVGIVSRLKRAQNAEDTDGSAEINTVVAAVTVDGEDRIINCIIDKVENKLSISNTGSIGSVANTEYPTTKELGDSYGMKGASPIGKEWNEQAAAYAQYAIGKTVDEVNGTAVTEGVPSDADLAASVTVHITDFNTVITKAVNSAK